MKKIKRITVSQRKKETANDYKYFPDPDLPKLYLHSIFDLENIKNNLPEKLSNIRIELKEIEIKEEYIELLLNNITLFRYFNDIKKKCKVIILKKKKRK